MEQKVPRAWRYIFLNLLYVYELTGRCTGAETSKWGMSARNYSLFLIRGSVPDKIPKRL